MSAKKDTPLGTLTVALILCVVCSVIVSTAAVQLRDKQQKNKELDRKKNILNAAGMLTPDVNVEEAFRNIETRYVNLDEGRAVKEGELPENYDQRKAVKKSNLNKTIEQNQDFAGIKKRAKFAPVYLVKNGDQIEKVILPIHGKGLWSTMYAFLALDKDLTTIKGYSYYEQGETPGLGAEVTNPKWINQWIGKKIYNEDGEFRAKVVKGQVDESKAEAKYQVDGISGATITANGVTNLMKYWLTEDGFGKYLENLKTSIANK